MNRCMITFTSAKKIYLIKRCPAVYNAPDTTASPPINIYDLSPPLPFVVPVCSDSLRTSNWSLANEPTRLENSSTAAVATRVQNDAS